MFIAPGFLSGTPCPISGGCSIGAKSPLANGVKEFNMDGTLGTYLAKFGVALIKIICKSLKKQCNIF